MRTWRCRGIWIRRCSFAPVPVIERRAARILDSVRGTAGTHFQPRPRHPATHAGRARGCAGRFRTRVRIDHNGRKSGTDARVRQSGFPGRHGGLPERYPGRASDVTANSWRNSGAGTRGSAAGRRSTRTRIEQAACTERTLRARGRDVRVYVGMRHWSPRIGDTVRRMSEDGVEEGVAIVMAPHFSRLSIGRYCEAVHGSAKTAGSRIRFSFVDSWWRQPALLNAQVAHVRAGLASFLRGAAECGEGRLYGAQPPGAPAEDGRSLRRGTDGAMRTRSRNALETWTGCYPIRAPLIRENRGWALKSRT